MHSYGYIFVYSEVQCNFAHAYIQKVKKNDSFHYEKAKNIFNFWNFFWRHTFALWNCFPTYRTCVKAKMQFSQSFCGWPDLPPCRIFSPYERGYTGRRFIRLPSTPIRAHAIFFVPHAPLESQTFYIDFWARGFFWAYTIDTWPPSRGVIV